MAVRKWVRLEGWAPMQRDWRPVRFGGAKRWEAEFPDWPPSSAGKVVFGGWNQILEAAGIQAKPPRWASEEILAALRAYALEFGRPPGWDDLRRPPTGYPSERAVRYHFGSLAAGLRAAGLEARRKQRWSQEAIIEVMREFRRETGRWPKSTDWMVAGGDRPTTGTVARHFGSWREGISRAVNDADR